MNGEKIYPTLSEEACVSHYNFSPEAKSDLDLPDGVLINDQTLREGEQAAVSGFSLEEKLEIARLLDDVGVHYIQVGYPGLSPSEDEMIRAVAKLGLKTKVGGLCLVYLPEWREQIERAADMGLDWVAIVYGLSPVRLSHMMKVPLEVAIERCLRATELAAKKKLTVSFGATDTTRTPLDTLVPLYRKAVEAGAALVNISDTAGAIGPTGMRFLVREIRRAVKVPVSVHCHNDLGLAVANTLAGLEAGASFVEVTVNGLGERAGNAPLDEVAAVLIHVYGYDVGLDLKKMAPLSRRVAELSRIPIPACKPLVGEAAFTHTLGAHQWGVRQGWFVYEPIRAEAVGNVRRLPLGRLTHHLLVKDTLEELGYPDLSEERVKSITEKVRSLAEREGRFVTREELAGLARKELG